MAVDQTVHKAPDRLGPTPNLVDYERAVATFSWADARRALDGLPGGLGLNIAYECVDRHVAGGRGTALALRFLERRGGQVDYTFDDLRVATNRFANVLAGLGVTPGDRVFVLTGRIPELYVSVLGTLKHRAVACTLFSAFGPEPIRQRMEIGDAAVLVTTEALYRRKIAPIRDRLPSLRHVLLARPADRAGGSEPIAGTLDLADLLAAAPEDYEIGPTDPETMALLHFTSGTTGMPKGAVHVHDAVVAHHATGRFALDLHPDDVFWCTADPGWVTGTSYGIIAPLAHGVTSVVDEAEFDAERWYGILEQEQRHRLVHGADRGPDAHEGRRRARAGARPLVPALRRQRRRAAQPGGGGVGRGGARAARSTTTGGRPRPAGS